MQGARIPFRFTAITLKYQGAAGWYFVNLPTELSDEIREHNKALEEGWGRLPVVAEISGLEWKTAIWFDTKQKAYLLPLKSEIRRKLKIEEAQELNITVYL